jgi:hypothetical protein
MFCNFAVFDYEDEDDDEDDFNNIELLNSKRVPRNSQLVTPPASPERLAMAGRQVAGSSILDLKT